ncbi:MAG: bifunctional diguanylate cyclase/phosphodiesterase [Dactylosporangium sp.]|nr:bifunctional diguanylate cyclase/phosphodiesterase [Dactylosporangium sp.]
MKLFVGLVDVSALALLIALLVPAGTREHLISWSMLAMAGVAALAEVPIRMRVRSAAHAFSSISVVILIGLTVAPPEVVIVATGLGTFFTKCAYRVAPIKVLFNSAKDVLAAGAAAAVGVALPGLAPNASLVSTLGTLALCALAYAAVDQLLVSYVIALDTGTSVWSRLRAQWDVRVGGVVARYVLATLGVSLLRLDLDPWLLLGVPVLGVSLHLAYANRLRAREEREAWQKLAQATDEFNAVDLDGVLHTAVARGADLFSADELEVRVETDRVPPRLVRGGTDGISYDGDPSDAPPATGNTISVRLEGDDGGPDVGLLTLRFRGTVELSEREQYTLRTFAFALCTAIRNAAAYAELARLAEQHAHNATHDALTGLANRHRLQDEATAALEQHPPRGITALLMIDLDRFKEVNDTLGHAAGDKVLVEVAHRMGAAAGEDALVARLGGDEFAVLLRRLAAPAIATHRAHAILASLTKPIEVEGIPISVEASIGIATAPSRGGVGELMRRADIAMYQAKRSGSRISVYTRAHDTANLGRLILGGDLPRAMAEHEIAVNFQPIVDLATGEVLAAEALARWHHPEKGDLDPHQFLATVERSGMLPAFADAVLDQALLAVTEWREAGFDLPVAVNVSPRSLLDHRFAESVAARLRHHGLPGDRLILELTESLTLSQLEVVDRVLGELRDQGIRLALDDFGTGYSSLSVLPRVPVHELKIDRAFVRDMEVSPEAAAIVRSTVDLGRSLGLAVVAEGVERESQRRALWELGCAAGQGHLFARPMPAARLLAALRRGSGGRPGTLAAPLHDPAAVIRIPAARRPSHQAWGSPDEERKAAPERPA